MISVAMTTYNGGQFLHQQLDSILSQTIDDFEVVICDDGSTDDTQSILKTYAGKDKRVKLFLNTTNLGFGKNFEKAISLCKGDYIALSDQDDIWYPNHLDILLHNIGNKMLACGNSKIIDKNGKQVFSNLKWQNAVDKKYNNCQDIAKTVLFYRNWTAGHDMMISRQFVDIALPIPTNVKYYDVWLFVLACVIDSAVYIESPTITQYRQHYNNASDKHIVRRSKILIWIKHFLSPNTFPDRLDLAIALKERIGTLTSEQQILLDEAILYHQRQHSWLGRLQNFIFEMQNRKIIYSIK